MAIIAPEGYKRNKWKRRFPLTATGSTVVSLIVASIVVLGCGYAWYEARVPPKDWVADCMNDKSRDESQRCHRLLKLGDVDGNGLINWHDAYVHDHCTRCPECCVTGRVYTDGEAEQWCGPDVCPGRCCHCFKSGGVWAINWTSFGTDDDPECSDEYPSKQGQGGVDFTHPDEP